MVSVLRLCTVVCSLPLMHVRSVDRDGADQVNYRRFMSLLDWQSNPVASARPEVCVCVCVCVVWCCNNFIACMYLTIILHVSTLMTTFSLVYPPSLVPSPPSPLQHPAGTTGDSLKGFGDLRDTVKRVYYTKLFEELLS